MAKQSFGNRLGLLIFINNFSWMEIRIPKMEFSLSAPMLEYQSRERHMNDRPIMTLIMWELDMKEKAFLG